MNTNYIIIKEYCKQTNTEPEFILDLESEGLIEISIIDNEQYLSTSQLDILERYIRWHYDLNINTAGIDVIQNLLDKIDDMQSEMNRLREIVRLIEK